MLLVRLYRHSRVSRQWIWHANEVRSCVFKSPSWRTCGRRQLEPPCDRHPISPLKALESHRRHHLTCRTTHRYLWLYAIVLKSFLVYVSDIFTAVTMLTTDSWSNQIFNSCPSTQDNGCVFIPFTIGKWLFVGCIIFSFLLVRSSIGYCCVMQ